MKKRTALSTVIAASLLTLSGFPLLQLQVDTITPAYAAAGGNGNGNGFGIGNGNGKGNGKGNGYSVPEPTTLPLLCMGIGGVMAFALRRKTRNGS